MFRGMLLSSLTPYTTPDETSVNRRFGSQPFHIRNSRTTIKHSAFTHAVIASIENERNDNIALFIAYNTELTEPRWDDCLWHYERSEATNKQRIVDPS